MDTIVNSGKTDTATFAAGCFWCVEAVFQDVEGVVSVTSGIRAEQLPTRTTKKFAAAKPDMPKRCA